MIVKFNPVLFTSSTPIMSEELVSTPVVINGVEHLMGQKKLVNLSSPDYAKEHFPNPEDYNLDNLIKSGAPLNEVSSPLLANTPNDVDDVAIDMIDKLSDDNNFKDNK